jgi:type VI secretion system protein ImpA
VNTQTSHPMNDIDGLLASIAGESPTGYSLRYEGTYDRIVEARRFEDPNLPRDVWDRSLKVAEWESVEEICESALRDRSKDFQIAAWLLESWAHLHDFRGIASGMELLLRLGETYWETAYPEPVEGDAEHRAAPFNWLNEKVADRLGFLRLAEWDDGTDGVIWADILRARLQTKVRSGGNTGEEHAHPARDLEAIRIAIRMLPAEYVMERAAGVRDAIEAVQRLEAFLDDRMGRDAPSLVRFRGVLADIHTWFVPFLPEDPISEDLDVEANAAGGIEVRSNLTEEQNSDDSSEATTAPQGRIRMGDPPVRTRAEAYARLLEIADFLQATEPHSPTPYLIRRAATWGHMSLRELLFEFSQDGLDLRALFTFLGLDEEEYNATTDEEEYS